MSGKKLLQAILDGQKSIKEDIERVEGKVENNGERIDKLGLELAKLSDDAPTNEEFDKLEKRVDQIETQVTSN